MHIHSTIQNLPIFKNAVITIGTFDGVHIGHQQIIQLMKTEAAAIGGETVIITFHPHPRSVIAINKKPISLLNTLEEKEQMLEAAGIDHLVIVPFTEAFAAQSASAYISDFLVKHFNPHTIIIGHDHRFGKDRLGDFELLASKAVELKYVVKEIPAFMLEAITISSTKIREALSKGHVTIAQQLLGYAYFFSGKIIAGNKLGRTIGFPTANLSIETELKLIPGNGVYAVSVVLQESNRSNEYLKGMMNIGYRPTVDGATRMIEVNLFDFDRNIYGATLTVHVEAHLRSEVKFNGLDALKAQLALDKAQATAILQSK
jgi:riboflavin kinase/FMN adenylyltransferase